MRALLSWLLGGHIDPNATLSLDYGQRFEPWLVFVLALAVVGFCFWVYRKDGRETTSPRFRTILGFLRGALLVIALFILSSPVLVATQVEAHRSVVLVLVDDSYSMDLGFTDASPELRKTLNAAMAGATVTVKLEGGQPVTLPAENLTPPQFKTLNRLNVVEAAFKANKGGEPFLNALQHDHDVRLYGFSKGISANTDDGKPLDPAHLTVSNLRGAETRIGDSLRAALREMHGQPLAGVVVLTDGRQNAGEDAVQAAAAFKLRNVPIFTVGVGDPSEPKDFEVSVEGPDMILPDDQSECTVFVRYKGYSGIASIPVEMKDGDRVVAKEDMKLGKPGEKTSLPLHFREAKPGKYTYTISIPEQPGEMRTDNNKATYTFQVVDKKVKVLFVEGQDLPRWEYRYLKNALRRDHTTECDVLLASGDGSVIWDGTEGKQPLDQFPITRKEIGEYDVIVVGDVSVTLFTADQTKLLRDFVREGGGLIFIAGERYDPAEYTQGAWFEMLPVVVAPRGSNGVPEGGLSETYRMELTPEGSKLPWTHLESDEHASREIWDNMPGMYWYYPVKKKKDLATVIATHPVDKDESGAKMPIIVTMPYGNGRTMFIGTDSLWRMRRGVGDKYHYRFYNQAIRYLSMAKRLGGQRRFQLSVDRNIVALGDKVLVNATVRDENLKGKHSTAPDRSRPQAER